MARFLPQVKVTDKDDQSYDDGDNGITWGVTLTGYADSVLGFSECSLCGGPGWVALLDDAGF